MKIGNIHNIVTEWKTKSEVRTIFRWRSRAYNICTRDRPLNEWLLLKIHFNDQYSFFTSKTNKYPWLPRSSIHCNCRNDTYLVSQFSAFLNSKAVLLETLIKVETDSTICSPSMQKILNFILSRQIFDRV